MTARYEHWHTDVKRAIRGGFRVFDLYLVLRDLALAYDHQIPAGRFDELALRHLTPVSSWLELAEGLELWDHDIRPS